MRVLMVCLGNICRSPMAEGILWNLANKRKLDLQVDSAGTANYHVGEAPDHRAIRCMRDHGIDISGLRGRQFSAQDFDAFDHILVMDRSNLRNVLALAKEEVHKDKVRLILEHLPESELQEVPDPWFGGMEDFNQVHSMLTAAIEGFLASTT